MITSSEQTRLPTHEWLAVLTILAFIAALAIITSSPRSDAIPLDPPHHLVAQEIEVTVEGAVEHPGVYSVDRSSTVGDAIAQAKPLPNADLKPLNLDKKVRSGQTIKVKKKRIKKSAR